MKKIAPSLLSIITIVGLNAIAAKASDNIDVPLRQLHQEVMAGTRIKSSADATGTSTQTGNASTVDFRSLASRFKNILSAENFSEQAGAGLRIGKCSEIAQRLLPMLKGNALSASNAYSEILDALETYVAKLGSNIDKGWVFQAGVANLRPPAGVPNAVPGMKPEAITDPQLRKQYTESIAVKSVKQDKNNQQDELRRARQRFLWLASSLVTPAGQTGWSRADLISRFAKDDDSRAILDDYLSKAGKLD